MSGLQQVHLRVNDAATGQPTPVRIRVTDAAGKYYPPLGRLPVLGMVPGQPIGGNVKIGGAVWAYIDGQCEILLPPGELLVQVHKGPEYKPLATKVQLIPGKLSVRLEIGRWCDFRRLGWHSGDTRVHFISPHSALLEARAEDVAVVQLLIRKTLVYSTPTQLCTAIANLDAFSGQTPCLQTPGHLVAVNTHNVHQELGSLGLLHCHRVVYPLTFGGSNKPDDWTLEDWCGQCHRKGGLVVWTRTKHRCAAFGFGEPLIDLLLGQVDAFELTSRVGLTLSLWYDLLNLGLRVPLAGASGKNSDLIAMGTLRNYVHLPADQDLTLSAWIEGLRAGRSFVTNGPLLEFTVNGQMPGSVVRVEHNTVRIRARVAGLTVGQRLSVLRNGLEVAGAEPSGSPAEATIDTELDVKESCWLAAHNSGGAFAHMSPVYVEVPHRPLKIDREAASGLLHEVERMIAWCQTKARCSTPQIRERLLSGFLKARERLSTLAGP